MKRLAANCQPPSPAACGLHADSWPWPLPAEPTEGSARDGSARGWPQRLLQMHQLQDCSAVPFPWECVLRHLQDNVSSSAEQQNEPARAFPQCDQCYVGRAQHEVCHCRKHLCDKLLAVRFQHKDKDRCKDTGFPSFQFFSFQDKTGVCRWETCIAADSLREGMPLLTGHVSTTLGTSLNW